MSSIPARTNLTSARVVSLIVSHFLDQEAVFSYELRVLARRTQYHELAGVPDWRLNRRNLRLFSVKIEFSIWNSLKKRDFSRNSLLKTSF